MTEKEIQDLGFTKFNETEFDGFVPEPFATPEELGELNMDDSLVPNDYYYYALELTHGLDLISNSSDEVNDKNEWYVEFFDTYPPIRIADIEEVKVLINVITKNKTTQLTDVDTDLLVSKVLEDDDLNENI